MSSKLIIKPSQCYSAIFTDNYKQCKCTDLVFLFLALDMFTPADPANFIMKSHNNKNTRKKCEVYSKLTIETPKRRHWPCFGVFTLNHEQANVCWGRLFFVSKHSKMLFLSKYKDSRMFQLLILLPWTGFYTMRYVGIHNNRILVNNKVQKQTQYKNSTTAVQKSPKTFLCG